MVDAPRKELCSFRIRAFKDNRKMSVVNPAMFPVYFGLHCREPWVAKDGFVFSKVREEKLEWNGSGPGSDV